MPEMFVFVFCVFSLLEFELVLKNKVQNEFA